MKYRHSFHAGNFADVHKHVALLALVQSLQRKDKGFLYLDTHAGAGRYALGGSNHGEARHGVQAFLANAADVVEEELRQYRDAVSALESNLPDQHSYPGSPLLVAHALRAQDRALYCELIPSECRALERALGGYRRARIECADGYTQLKAALPPVERRALVLIDPPYENPTQEFAQAGDAAALILQRLANAVIALWYPIKDERAIDGALATLEHRLAAPTLRLEFWLFPRDSRVGLNGSGLLLINPPYQFEQRATLWQAELLTLLDKTHLGGQSVQWLRGAAGLDHVGA